MARVEELLGSLTLKEKVHLMTGSTPEYYLGYETLVLGRYNRNPYPAGGIPSKNIPALRFVDGPRGVVCSESTCFPVSIARGATWDPELEERVGDAIAKEVRAVGGNYFGGVCVNLVRHPAMGRAQESFGEDPCHVGRMGAALVRGVQRHNVMACVKHFALNNQENTRFKIDVTCSERVLREVYLPHFHECVVQAKAASVMGAYNKFRGDHCCENAHLLRKVLKQDWRFDGFVISDFNFGVRHTSKAANAGCDVEMASPKYFGSRLVKAVRREKVSEADVIDDAVRRILRTILDFEARQDPLESYPADLRGAAAHAALAEEVALKSMVLLQNEKNALPLSDLTDEQELLIVGDLARTANIGDHGSSQVHPKHVATVLEGLAAARQRGDLKAAVKHVGSRGGERALREAAARASAVVVVAGYSHSDEGEYLVPMLGIGGDRKRLTLSSKEEAMIEAVSKANRRVVVVLIGSAAIMCERWRGAVSGIMMAFYPGQEGGHAVARTLVGANAHLGGKLPFAVPTDEAHLAPFDRSAKTITYALSHGYTLLDKLGVAPAFAFGHGLSLTRFELRDFEAGMRGTDEIRADVTVENVGDRPGDEVVQLYIAFEGEHTVERQKKLLRDFKRVALQPGESAKVSLRCSVDSLRYWNEEKGAFVLDASPSAQYRALVGTSSTDLLGEGVPITLGPQKKQSML